VVGSVVNNVLARLREPLVVVGPLVDWRLSTDGVLALHRREAAAAVIRASPSPVLVVPRPGGPRR
jgi:hypothetical protein